MSTITITSDVFHRIAALAAFAAPKSSNTPVLQGVALSVAGGELRAVATDRYTVARITHEHAECDELEQIIIPVDALAAAAKGAKNSALISLTELDDGEISLDWGTRQIRAYTITGNFPPVDRPYPDMAHDLPAGTVFDPALLAKLAKLTKPARSPKDRAVMFALSADEPASNGRANLRAQGDVYDVLICPRLILK